MESWSHGPKTEFHHCTSFNRLHHRHHHHHLFLKRPFLPRSARVRRFSRYEVSPHIPEHYPFRVQTQLLHIIPHTFSPSLPAPTRTSQILPLPPPHFYRPTPNHLHSYAPHAQTTSIYHASPPQPHSEPFKDCTNPHCIFYPSATPHTSISPSSAPFSPIVKFSDLHNTFSWIKFSMNVIISIQWLCLFMCSGTRSGVFGACSVCSECICYMLKNNKKTEHSLL